jgi:hypothetical protein
MLKECPGFMNSDTLDYRMDIEKMLENEKEVEKV